MRNAGMFDMLAHRVDDAITAGLAEIRDRLAPTLLEHAARLTKAAPKLPVENPFEPAAGLAAKAGPAFDAAQEACAALLTIAAPFQPRPGTFTDIPLPARPLIAITEVGTVVPQTTTSIGQLDDYGNTPQEAARYKAVRQMHTDANVNGANVALVRAAAGAYGDHVSFALAHPDDLLNRAQQHTNAEPLRGHIQQDVCAALS